MTFKGIDLCCPHCRGDLHDVNGEDAFRCETCDRRYPVVLGIPDLRAFPDPYIASEADRAKGRNVGAHLDDMDFAELVAYYYSITSVVPPRHAQQYTRGLLAGVARSEAALASWQQAIDAEEEAPPTSLLDIGCGTAPLLVAAAPHIPNLVGVDIAFRWLVVAKKRLMDAGLDLPLICACAEALPFRDSVFDRVVMESVIEHVKDQEETLQESRRVLRPGGFLFATTPNHYSLGPDPHTGLWAGSLLPDRWTAAYVKRMGGIPPRRQLLSAGTLRRLLQRTGFQQPRVMLPDIPDGQRTTLSPTLNRLIDVYHGAKRLPGTRHLLRLIGPLLHAVAQKPEASHASE